MTTRAVAALALTSATALLLINIAPHGSSTTAAAASPDAAAVPAAGAKPAATRMHDLIGNVQADTCARLFIDGGANTGEAVDAFVAGSFYHCALSGPFRIYRASWPQLSQSQRQQLMAPLSQPSSFCIRSFEAAAPLLPPLRAQEAKLRQRGFDVRFIDGALGNVTGARVAREVVTYGSHPQAQSAVTFRFDDIHVAPGGVIKPRALATRQTSGASYDLVELVRRVLERNRSAIISIRLDVRRATS